jgi:hypothetical protein
MSQNQSAYRTPTYARADRLDGVVIGGLWASARPRSARERTHTAGR